MAPSDALPHLTQLMLTPRNEYSNEAEEDVVFPHTQGMTSFKVRVFKAGCQPKKWLG